MDEGCVYKLHDSENQPHYHIIVFKSPRKDDKRYILVYLTKSKSWKDTTTEFMPNEESFITDQCWVKYRNSKILHEAELNKHQLQIVGQISPASLEKIRMGFLKQKDVIPREIVALYEEWEEERLFNRLH